MRGVVGGGGESGGCVGCADGELRAVGENGADGLGHGGLLRHVEHAHHEADRDTRGKRGGEERRGRAQRRSAERQVRSHHANREGESAEDGS